MRKGNYEAVKRHLKSKGEVVSTSDSVRIFFPFRARKEMKSNFEAKFRIQLFSEDEALVETHLRVAFMIFSRGNIHFDFTILGFHGAGLL